MSGSKTSGKWRTGIAVSAAGVLGALVVTLVGSGFPSKAIARDRAPHEQALKSMVLTRAYSVPAALGMIRHTTYEDDGLWVGDFLENTSPLLLLGREGGRMIGLTTQCAVNFKFPDYVYWDPEEAGAPEFVMGVAELTFKAQLRKPAYFLVDHEMDWKFAELPQWHQGFSDYFAKAMPHVAGSMSGLPVPLQGTAGDVDRLRHWHGLRASKAVLKYEPLGDHDLALVSFPEVDGLQTLSLEKPREKVIQMLKDIPFSKMLGRDLLLRCENCLARMEGKRVKPGVSPSGAALARVGCFLVAKDLLPIVSSAIEMVPTMVNLVSEGVTGVGAAGRFERLAKAGHLGLVLDVTGGPAVVRSGHMMEIEGKRYRLAHVHSKDERGRLVLEEALQKARESGQHVLAIVEATTFDGDFITHLVVPETKTYLNLMLVQEGVAQAYAHREPLRTAELFELMRFQERVASLLK